MATRGVAPVHVVAVLAMAAAFFAQEARAIGVCYGVNGDNLPSRSDVVLMYRSNGIANMRIYFADREALDALRGSGIGLILDVGTEDKVREFAADPSSAASWVRDSVQAYYPDVNIRYVAVGNELTGTAAAASVLPAMRNVRDALAAAGLDGSVKVSTAVSMGTVDSSSPPSAGVFRGSAVMNPIARFLADTGAPLLANVYPYFAYAGDEAIDLDFGLFRPGSRTVTDPGTGLTYTNLFDAMVDAVRAAMDKAGGGGVDVIVAESGWPSADGRGATVDNARTYNQNLIDHVGNGTPRKPGALETYVFAMFNENQKQGDPTEKKFGLFNPEDRTPVYPINFAGN